MGFSEKRWNTHQVADRALGFNGSLQGVFGEWLGDFLAAGEMDSMFTYVRDVRCTMWFGSEVEHYILTNGALYCFLHVSRLGLGFFARLSGLVL